MITSYTDILLSLLAGAIFASALLPAIRRIAVKRNLYDIVDCRKIHNGNVPRLGGVTFMPALVMGLLSVCGINILFGYNEVTQALSEKMSTLIFSALALIIIYFAGIADDIFGIRYRTKFSAQLICGIMLILGGVTIPSFSGIFGIDELSPWASIPFTILMTIFIINAMNLIDGIDGLATLLFQLALFTYGLISLLSGDVIATIISAAGIGITIPFLRYNLFGNEKHGTKMFMGDTGSMTLGLLITILGIHMMQNHQTATWINPAIAALSPIIVPCFDVLRVYRIRLMAHKSPFLPDRNHIHHRLLDLGLSQHKALGVLITWSAAITIFNILLSTMCNVNIIFAFDVAIWIVSTSCLSRLVNRRLKSQNQA